MPPTEYIIGDDTYASPSILFGPVTHVNKCAKQNLSDFDSRL